MNLVAEKRHFLSTKVIKKFFAYTFKTEVMTSKNGTIWALFGKSWLFFTKSLPGPQSQDFSKSVQIVKKEKSEFGCQAFDINSYYLTPLAQIVFLILSPNKFLLPPKPSTPIQLPIENFNSIAIIYVILDLGPG